ncbi:hypothetical protein ACFFX1_10735 [Dactylosporangium sucinum]|uniref:Uncharacterized protein n=1 Tax=Dactylosporangium sucinum TaxID=1424081 RepID=A0A917WRA5_9ACTN|nr:hypothetical protein [Dactylosporangium sucinum]GGM23068.1 hypothetical protein GCM10007977_025360 [Dactylosporangium sucinum]
MSDRSPVEGLPTWSDAEESRFDRAQQTLRALVGAYAERISAADETAAEQLRAEQVRYGRELATLDPADPERLSTIINDYPALVERVRAGA